MLDTCVSTVRLLDIDALVAALERVSAGETIVDLALIAQLVNRARRDDRSGS